MADASDFLNSKSMLTPGLAGGVVMVITNTLSNQFGLTPAWTALALSFVLGLMTLTDRRVVLWQRAVFYFLNSLIIFSVATGTNAAGQSIQDQNLGAAFKESVSQVDTGFFMNWLNPS